MNLKDIATNIVITLAPTDSIDQAIASMEEHGIHHLPVVDEAQAPVGMVSDRDLLSAAGWLSHRDRIDPQDGTLIGPRQVREVMSKPVRTLDPSEPVEAGARLMLDETISAVVLVVDGRLEGLITDTDFLKCYTDDRPLGTSSAWRFRKVADHMSPHIYSLQPDDITLAASRLMRERRIRHVLITQDGHLVGIVSDRDVREAVFRELVESQQADDRGRGQFRRVKLRDIMSRRVETAGPSTTLADAADRMTRAKVSALPIMEQQRLLGIITETDLLKVFVTAFAG
jgi:acetoin utilization protein AcuB